MSIDEILDVAFFSGLVIVVAFGDHLRIFGGAFFLLALVMICASTRFSMTRKDQIWLPIFVAVTVVYIFFSYLHLLPYGWTTYYNQDVIPNQSVSVLSFAFVVAASQRWWTRLSVGLVSSRKLVVLALTWVILGLFIDRLIGGSWTFERISATLRSGNLIYIFVLAFFAVRGSFLAWVSLLASAAFTILVGKYLQTGLIYLIVIGLISLSFIRMHWGKGLVRAYITTLLALSTYGIFHAYQIWRLDFNTGWRMQFWHDVLQSTVLTGGFGVGFGTEALKDIYPGLANRVFSETGESFLLIGTHSGFMDTLLRMGVFGLVPLAMIFWTSFPRISKVRHLTNLCAVAFVLAFTCTFTNVGLQSPLYMLGIAFCLGYVRAQNV